MRLSPRLQRARPRAAERSPQLPSARRPERSAIRVEGNQRIEEGTICSYMLVQPGDPFDPELLDRSLKTLYATGLFQDVTLGREGNTLVVKVVENPIVNRIAFEGNHKLTDDAAARRAAVCVRARSSRRRSPRRTGSGSWTSTHGEGGSTRGSNRRSSGSTRTGSMSCSRSTRASSTLDQPHRVRRQSRFQRRSA